MTKVHNLTPRQIGDLAEVAVLLRLVSRGFSVFRGVFEGSSTDWTVRHGRGPLLTIQVKTAKRGVYGAPMVPLTHAHSRKLRLRYTREDWDYIVGFDLFSDTAFVWSWEETQHLRAAVSATPAAKERWDKLLQG